MARALSLVLLVTLGWTAAAGALDWNSWFATAAKQSYMVRVAVLSGQAKESEFNKKMNQGVRVSQPYDVGMLAGGEMRAEGDGVRFGDALLRADQQYKNETHRDKFFFLCYRFPLTRDIPVILRVNFAAAAVFLNGRPLTYAGRNFWSDTASFEIKGQNGENIVTVVPEWTLNHTPQIQVFPGDTLARAREALKAETAALLPAKIDWLYGMLNEYAADAMADGAHAAAAFAALTEFVASLPPKDAEAGRVRFGSAAAETMQRLWQGGGISFYDRILSLSRKSSTAEWTFRYTFIRNKAIDEWLLRNTARLLLECGRRDEVKEFLSAVTANLQAMDKSKEIPNAKRQWERLANALWHFIHEEVKRSGDNALAIDLLGIREKIDREQRNIPAENENYKRIENSRSTFNWQLRVAAKLTPSPEVEQSFEELQNLLAQDEPQPESIGKIYRIFRKFGSQLKSSPNGLCVMRMDMLRLLRQKGLYDALVKEAAGRIGNDIKQVGKRGDLSALTAILGNFNGLLPMDGVRHLLLQEYCDRGQWRNAHYHAMYLTSNASDARLRETAAAYLLVIEQRLNIPAEQRYPLPAELAGASVNYQGRKLRLSSLAQDLNGRQTAERAAGGPGSYAGTLELGIRDTLEANAHPDIYNRRENLVVWQPIEPVVTGNAVFAATPFAVQGWRPDGKNWRFEGAKHFNDYEFRRRVAAFGGSGDGGNAVFVGASERGSGRALRSFAADGKLLWDSSDYAQAREWQPLSAPHHAFGRLFALAAKQFSNNWQIALIEINSRSGEYLSVTPVQTTSININDLAYSGRMVSDSTGIYGSTGAGTVFAINPDSLSVSWITALAEAVGRPTAGSPGDLHIYGENIVTYSPASGEFAAVSRTDGSVRWRTAVPELRFLHRSVNSENSDSVRIIYSAADGEREVVAAINPQSGRRLWQIPTGGLGVTGEGVMTDEKLYLPCVRGIAVLTVGGRGGEILPLAETPRKLCYSGGRWLVVGDRRLHVFTAQGNFEGGKIPAAAPATAPAAAPAIVNSLPPLDFLQPLEALPFPRSHRQWPANPAAVRLMPERFFTLQRDDLLTVCREGGFTAEGKYTAAETLSTGFYPNLRVGDRFFSTHTASRADFYELPSRRSVFTFNAARSNGVASELHHIREVFINDTFALILCNNHRAILVDLAAGKTVRTFEYNRDSHEYYMFTPDYFVYRSHNNKLWCINPREGKVRWQLDNIPGHWMFAFADNREDGKSGFCLGKVDNQKIQIMNVDEGKFYDIAGNFNRHNFWHILKNGNEIYLNNCQVIDWNAKKFQTGHKFVRHIAIKGNRAAYMKFAEKDGRCKLEEMAYIASGKKLLLENTPDSITSDVTDAVRQHWVPFLLSVGQVGDRLYAQFNRWLLVYTLDGKFIEGRHIFAEETNNCHVDFLRSSVLVQRCFDQAYLLGGRAADKPLLTTQVNRAYNGNERNGVGFTEIRPEDWTQAAQGVETRGYAMRAAVSNDKVYLTLRAPAQTGDYEEVLKLNAFNNDSAFAFNVCWRLNRSAHAAGSDNLQDKLESWIEKDDAGRRYFHMVIAKSAYTGDNTGLQLPRLHWQIEANKYGKLLARTVCGESTINAGLFSFAPFNFAICQEAKNYQLREKIYGEASGFIPQGEDLLNWLAARRPIAGVRGNLDFLQGMLTRNAGFPSAANVLSAMLLENLLLAEEENPRMLAASNEYFAHARRICDELKKRADELKIPPAYSIRGLTALLGGAYRHWGNSNTTALRRMIFRNERHQEILGFDISTYCPFLHRSRQMDVLAVPLGAFSGNNLFKQICRVTLHAYNGHQKILAGGWRLIFPGGERVLVTDNGEAGPEVRLDRSEGRTLLSTAEKRWHHRIASDGGIFWKHPDFPDAPKDSSAISPASLLLALQNLPSDSRIGFSLADAYVNTTRDIKDRKDIMPPVDVYRLMLQRVGGDWWQYESAAHRLKEYYYNEKKDWDEALRAQNKVLKEAGCSRSLQRGYYSYHHNCISWDNIWLTLGAFNLETDTQANAAKDGGGQETETAKKNAEEFISPLPESAAAPLEAAYTVSGKKQGFQPRDRNPGTAFNNFGGSRNVVYYAATVSSDKDRKAYFFFRNNHWAGERIAKITVFNNTHQEGEVEMPGHSGNSRLYDVPIRLAKGNNIILFKIEFAFGLNINVSFGDVCSVPIKGVGFVPRKK